MDDDARGGSVLRFPEKIGMQTVCLNTPGNSLQKPIIKTAADGPRARSVRQILAGPVRLVCATPTSPWTKGVALAILRKAPDQARQSEHGRWRGRAVGAWNSHFTAEVDLPRAVGPSEIGHRFEQTDRLVLQRAIPSMEAGRSKGRNQRRASLGCRNRADLRIAAENVHLAELLGANAGCQ